MSKEKILEEFDKIFENLKLKDIQIAGLLILFSKAIDQTREETIRGEIEYWKGVFDKRPKNRDLESDNIAQNFARIEIERLQSLINLRKRSLNSMRIKDEKIKLTDDQRQTLEVINKVYLGSGHGSASIMVTTPQDELNYLELRGFIFKSKGVYFPSTKGQEYLLNN